MPSLLHHLLSLTLLSLLFTLAESYRSWVSVAEAEAGSYPGTSWISPRPPEDGDWLSQTFCHCLPPEKPLGPEEIGFVYQWEYYNVHLNRTFEFTWVDDKGPLSLWQRGGWLGRKYSIPLPNDIDDTNPEPGNHQPDAPRYEGERTDRDHDELLIWPKKWYDGDFENQDAISWNGQFRALGEDGHQGWSWFDDEYVNGTVCPGVCGEFMEWEHKVKNATGHGTKYIWDSLDDMCDGCK